MCEAARPQALVSTWQPGQRGGGTKGWLAAVTLRVGRECRCYLELMGSGGRKAWDVFLLGEDHLGVVRRRVGTAGRSHASEGLQEQCKRAEAAGPSLRSPCPHPFAHCTLELTAPSLLFSS